MSRMHGPKVEIDGLTRVHPQSRRRHVRASQDRRLPTGSFALSVRIVYTDDKTLRKDMKFITKVDGPYHLHSALPSCDIETPQSIAEAVLLGEVTVASDEMHSEVVAVAKRNLNAGEKVAGIGSADIRGCIYTYGQARELKAIPLGIAAGGTVTKSVSKGCILTEENFTPDSTTFIYRLRKEQDNLLAPQS
jgi:predicted homoserine dehydrogenase-like protein